jgi:general secretion pathway protein E
MVGEMRDQETAEIAVQAAMTGHLVLSTLHTNDALGAVPRLVDLGVPEYLVAATLELVVAQRLVRKLCRTCAVEVDADPARVASLADRPVLALRACRAVGCDQCRGTGYRGRTGVFEAVRVGESMRRAISARATQTALREIALEEGFVPMRGHALELVRAGITSVEEVLRAVQD